MSQQTWTILKVIQWTTDYFRRKGLEQPRSDAEVLLAHALGMRRMDLYLRYDQPLDPEELARYRALIQRRAAREPVQYITGRQEFWSLELEVTPAALIPRPETERLVELALEAFPDTPLRALDIGTGSGAVAIALAKERPRWSVVACDISEEALHLARRNAARHAVADRIDFVRCDLASPFRLMPPPFQLICANPPYIGDAEWAGLSPEITRFEPRVALLGGGPEGTQLPARLLREAVPLLRPGGVLLMEMGSAQAQELQNTAESLGAGHLVSAHKDYGGKQRVLRIVKALSS